MSVKLIICEDALDPETWYARETDDVCAALAAHFVVFPDTARLYHNEVSQDHDITPSCVSDIEKLQRVEGTVYAVVYPADPITIVVAIVAVAVTAVAAFLLIPTIPNSEQRNTQTESPNNALSERQNKPRPAARIPDIYGRVTSTPDLIAVPYSVFENHQEIEYAYMCVGRGEYEIAANTVRDDATLVSGIAGASVEVFGPNTSPNSGDGPQLRIGTAINETVKYAAKSTAVNGQVLRAFNIDSFAASGDVRFVAPDEIHLIASSDEDFTDFFDTNDVVDISRAAYTGEISGSGVNTDEVVRFTPSGTIEFETSNTDDFTLGDTLTVTGAYYIYSTSQPGVYEDFSDGVGDFTAYGGGSLSISSSALTIAYASGTTYGGQVPIAPIIDNTAVKVVFDLVSLNGATTGIRVGLQGGGAGWTSNNVTVNSVGRHTVDLDAVRDASDARVLFFAPYASGSFVINNVVIIVGGGVGSVNLSGTYVVNGKTPSSLSLLSPENVNDDWNLISPNFPEGHTMYLSCGLVVPSGSVSIDLAGTYTVLSVSSNIITLANPAAVNVDWNTLAGFVDGRTTYARNPLIETNSVKWVGPFTLDRADLSAVYCNFIASGGMFKDNGEKQKATDVEVRLELVPVDATDTPTGAAEYFNATVYGSATSRTSRAVTIKAEPTFTGRCTVRARRVTPLDLEYEGTVVDEVKWRDLYQIASVTQTHFGDVTTVQAVTYATSGALSVKERKLNLEAVRKIPTRVNGTTFTTNQAAEDAANILVAVCVDPRIGGRPLAELDLDNIYDTIDEVVSYFGHDNAAKFSYTFNSDNTSFEETVASIASAVFCTAYRRGNVIKLTFEKKTEDSTLLFNHRNKIPGTETRTVRFGNQDDNDGVEYNYISPEDGALVTLYLPTDQSAVNPKKVDSIGVRNDLQAYFAAWRVWNKIRKQNVSVEFDATQEAGLLVLSDRILVADNTRTGTIDGEIISQSGLTVELSQPVTFEGGESYTCFLQHTDSTVEAIGITAGSDDYHAVLAFAPRLPLNVDEEAYARATYIITPNSSTRERAFLVAEREPQDNFTSTVRAVNYSDDYYAEDDAYAQGRVDLNGNPI